MKSFVSMKMIMLMNVMTLMSLSIARFEEIIFIIKTWLLFFLCFCVQFGKFWIKLGGLEVRETEFRFLCLLHWLPVEKIIRNIILYFLKLFDHLRTGAGTPVTGDTAEPGSCL